MTPEREKVVRDFVKRYDQWPKSTWKNQDYMRELLGEIDSLRQKLSEAENALSWVGQPCT